MILWAAIQAQGVEPRTGLLSVGLVCAAIVAISAMGHVRGWWDGDG